MDLDDFPWLFESSNMRYEHLNNFFHTILLIEVNIHIKEIQERLGHSDINTTMDIYAHMTKNMKKKASTKFGKLMNSLSEKIKS